MPFPFRYICDLLQDLEDDIRKAKSYPTSGKAIIARWFDQHRLQLHAPGNDVCAILSTLLPERRTDRVYFIQAPRLQSIVGQALCLGFSRVAELRRYQTPGLGIDLGDCVERILERTPNSTSGRDDLTVEDIDAVLEEIAAACRFSSPKIQSRRTIRDTNYANEALGELYRRLGAQEAKWFTRLVLKSYEPVVLDQYTVFRSYHYLLPRMLKVRDDLTITTAFLRHAEQSPGDQVRIASILKPQLGTKVGRQTWIKGRSIKHCLDMGRRRVISCEQKLDGEYCQIHIDRSKGYQCIHIFSKSGKDSTVDRSGLHGAIRGSLKLDEQDCPVKKGCILEGELLVYSNKDHKILPFHKIRKHVSRSGSFIGTNHDSQPHEYEHLMIVYYDLLMIDDESLLGLRHSERRRRLTRLITCRTGHAAIVQHQDVSLARRSAASQLRKAFADCIVNRGEGLVLKPDEPYFDFGASSQPYASCIFKLKKEYVQGWGDVGDFAVVGASYDSVKAKTYNLPNLKWTHFFIGCLDNQARPTAGIRKPRFRVVNMVELNATMLKTVTQCSPLSVPFDGNTAFDLDLSGLGTNKPPTVLFPEPMVFDVRCFSFDKASNTNFWSMRFPMVSKVHFDRSWKDTISFDEMQEAAVTATEVPEQEDSQEMREWVTALEKADPWGIAVDAISQTSSLSEPIVSQTVVEQQHEYVSTLDAILEASENPLHSRAQGREAGVPGALLTPPRSSAVVAARTPGRASPAFHLAGSSSTTSKRQCETVTDTPTSKRPRRGSHAHASDPPSGQIAHEEFTHSPISTRQPLGQIDANSSQGEQVSPRSTMPDASSLQRPRPPASTNESLTSRLISPAAASVHAASNALLSSAGPKGSTSHRVQLSLELASSPRTGPDTPSCSHAGSMCALANCPLLLAPCIATYAWISDTLLKEHGIHHFHIDPMAWVQDDPRQSLPKGSDRTMRQLRVPHGPKRPRVRKICLVESRCAEATKEFMESITRAGPKRKDGEREWVEVYDWRLLEALTDTESRKGAPGNFNPWRKYRLGLA